MALELAHEMPSGVSGNYWRIVSLQLQKKQNTTTVSLGLFLDHAASDADKALLHDVSYTWAGADNPCTVAAMDVADSNPYKLAYDKLKTLTAPIDFTTAVDA